ncbi:MAG: hypothetical protein KDE04_20040, partial [Anaerolineales bacterium]|nr:hypothetical protein [Anaerolineales bacterium]
MKRLTIITILLLVLIGCHSDDETPTPATPADTLALSTPEPADLTPLARPSANSDEYWLFWRIVLDVNETPC